MSRKWSVLILAAALSLTACGRKIDPMPETYPVRGKVTQKDGTVVTGGMVQFQSQAVPSVITNAMIQSDGSYELRSLRDGLRASGAVAGPNRVIVFPGNEDDGNMTALTLPTPFVVQQRDNEFNITLGNLQ